MKKEEEEAYAIHYYHLQEWSDQRRQMFCNQIC